MVLTPTVERDWPPSPEELFNTGDTAPAKRMLVEQSQMDEYARERNTRRCLDSGGAQGLLLLLLEAWKLSSNRSWTGATESRPRLMAWVTAVDRKTNDISKRMDSTNERMLRLEAEMQDMRRRQDAPLSLASLSSRPTASRGSRQIPPPLRRLRLPPGRNGSPRRDGKGRSYPSLASRPTVTSSKSRNMWRTQCSGN